MKRRLRSILMCLMLGAASLYGTNMRPDEIEELLACMNQAKIAHVLVVEQEDSE
jgi:hypothetical protein